MKINRKNYESYFVDAVEGNLDSTQQKELDIFLAENPDLRDDYFLFSQTVLISENLSFEDKDYLKKSILEETKHIRESNYEDYFIAYYEDCLSKDEKTELQLFLRQNPSLNKSFESYASLRLESDAQLIFPDKESLKQNAVPFRRWFPYSAAASVIILIAVFMSLNNFDEFSSQARLVQQKNVFFEQKWDVFSINETIENPENPQNQVSHNTHTIDMTAEVMQLREAEIHPMQEIREIPLAENLAEYNDLETNDKYFNLYQNMRLRQLMRLKEKKVFPMVRFAKDNEFEDFNNQAQNVFALLLPDKILGFNISNMQVEDENEIKKQK